MLLTGQSAEWHPWRVSSPVLKRYLEETGLFEVDYAKTPQKGGDMEKFRPNFSDYDVVVIDYEGDIWSESTKKAFVEYVESGGGVVFYHAANNNFPDWKEFNEIAGLSGWGDRDEKAGPMVRFREGEFVLDTTPGQAGEHGPQHKFQIINRVRNHPITKGLPEKWMHAKDELYARLRGPAENLTVLATAYADPEKGGTGEHEPILFTVGYGKGRAFNTALGHASEPPLNAIECVGFITTFQRGAEWAATGNVTQPIPQDFPTATKVSIRKLIKQVNVKELLENISDYEYGRSRKPLIELEEFLDSAPDSPETLKETEKQFNEFLRTDATLDAKEFICRKLSVIGSENSVPTLSAMLPRPGTADMARYALERIEGEAVDKALRKTLIIAAGKKKVGIINTLGARGDEKSVGVLAGLIYDNDLQLATAAVAALGQIGNSRAAAVLADATGKAGGKLKQQILHAYLNCADNLKKQGKSSEAIDIYTRLYHSDNPQSVRIGALRGMVLSGAKDSEQLIINAIKGKNNRLQAQGLALMSNIKDAEKIKQITDYMPNLSATAKIQLLAALTGMGQSAAGRQAAVSAAKDQAEEVRIAALEALAVLGDESTVSLLAEGAASAVGAEREAARESLYSMPGKKVDEAIIDGVPGARPDVKIELIRAVGGRRIDAGADTLMTALQDSDSSVRLQCWKTLGDINVRNLAGLVKLLGRAQNDTERKEAEKTVAVVANTFPKGLRAMPILEGLASTDNVDAACSLLRVLGKTGGDGGLDMLRGTLGEDDPAFVDAAVRGLAEWPDDEPMDDLLQIVKTSDNKTHKVLALRAYIRMIGLDSERTDREAIEMYRLAMSNADDTDAKKTVLSCLATVNSLEALKFAAEYLRDDALGREAAASTIRIAPGLIRNGLGGECKPILEKILTVTEDEDVRRRTRRMLKWIEEEHEGDEDD
ncbi:MAG TPA: hypothetical protein HPP87_03660 [Planctomycetes bacterium]|nr:hypothetical protein [Planctomycetota bacterium]